MARAYDAMIAATAIANDVPLCTCNPGDYEGIDGLQLVALAVPRTGQRPSRARIPRKQVPRRRQPETFAGKKPGLLAVVRLPAASRQSLLLG